MSDLISRQEVLDILRMCYETERIDYTNGNEYINYEQAVHEVEQLEPAHPEIIRCKDCKYRDENWRRVSVKWLPCIDVRTGSNWFCGSAERREE